MLRLLNAQDGIALLRSLGASPWLVRHHELVVETAVLICDALEKDLSARFDRDTVLVGASIHDAGKIVHPEEMSAGGNRHEVAGKELLVRAGVPAAIARCARRSGARCVVGKFSFKRPDVSAAR